MKKFYLIAVIIGTIFITIVSGCAVKTVDTKNVNQEMERSKRAPVVGKIPAKEKTSKLTKAQEEISSAH